MKDDLPIEFEFTCAAAPVQAEGAIAGQSFYFRARGNTWTFAIAERKGVDPVSIDSAASANGRGWFRSGEVGVAGDFAASYLPLEEARQIIDSCARAYLRECNL